MKGLCCPVIILPEEMEGIVIRVVRSSQLEETALCLKSCSIVDNDKVGTVEMENCRIPFEDILWIAVKDVDSCTIALTQKKTVIVKLDLETVEKELPPADFVRISRTCIVNLQQVRSMIGNSLKVGDSLLTIAPGFRKQVCSRFVFIGVRFSPG